jgi:hypothetical protein
MLRTTVFLGISMVEQKHRRRLVAMMYVVLVVAIAASVLACSHVPGRYASLVSQLFILPLFVAWRILRDMVGEMEFVGQPAKMTSLGLSGRRDQDEPDERDVTVRNAAYFNAYRVLATYSILASLVAVELWNSSHTAAPLGLFLVMLVIATTLPQAILLWTEPDVPGESV